MKVRKELGQISALIFADWLLKHYGPMSHLKLQKLLYYCDAYHLAYFSGRQLVPEEFQAWVHGPVCVEVYHELKGNSVLYADIVFDETKPDPDPILEAELCSVQFELIEAVLNELYSWKDSELENATHSEDPWIEARGGIPLSQKHSGVISKESMAEFYKSDIIEN